MEQHNVASNKQGMIGTSLLVAVMLFLGNCPVWAAPKGSPWGREYFPHVKLVNQDGKTQRFYDDLIKDKVVAINFIYTQCSDSCPMETANLRRVQTLLEDRIGKDIYFYSISIDADRDNPKALKEYAERFRIGPGWTFLTGKKEDVTLLRKKLGLYTDGEDQLNEHHTSFIIGNESTGQWIKRSPSEDPMSLARALSYQLSKHKTLPGKHAKYSEAKPLAKQSEAEKIYSSRCSACHSLGDDDGIGPGLQGITQRRDRKWLTRWLKEPDLMLGKKDPIAVDLYKRYKKVIMPNLRLDDSDVEALIDFMSANNAKQK